MEGKHQLLKYFIYFIVFALNLMAFNFCMECKENGKENEANERALPTEDENYFTEIALK